MAAAAAPLGGLRLWFAAYLIWLLVLCLIARRMFNPDEAADPRTLLPGLLALTAFYLSLCNTLLPLPTAWILLLSGSDAIVPFGAAWLRITLVTVVSATATMIANLNEYHVLGYFFRARLGERLRRARTYRWALRWFDVAPFRTLTLVAFVPIPVDFVRWLAILRRYPRWRFAAAYWLGRLPRYALLAGLAAALHLGPWAIVLIQVGIVALLGARLLWAVLARPVAANPASVASISEQAPPG